MTQQLTETLANVHIHSKIAYFTSCTAFPFVTFEVISALHVFFANCLVIPFLHGIVIVCIFIHMCIYIYIYIYSYYYYYYYYF